MASPFLVAVDPAQIMVAAGMEPTPWQARILRSKAQQQMLLCARQAGKSTTVSAAALHEAGVYGGRLVLILSSTQKQAREVLKRIVALWKPSESAFPVVGMNQDGISFKNGSRIESIPTRDRKSVDGYSPNLVILDEAASIHDDVYLGGVVPSVSHTKGRVIALTTPKGARGWFFSIFTDRGRLTVDDATKLDDGWQRTVIRATDCDHLSARELDDFRNLQGEVPFAQEYMCEFVSDEEVNLNKPLTPSVVDAIPVNVGGEW